MRLAILLIPAMLLAAPLARGTERVAMSLSLGDGTLLKATFQPPRGASPQSRVPLILLFGGFENAAHVLDLVKVDSPIALATFDYPYGGPRDSGGVWQLVTRWPEVRRVFPRSVEGIRRLVHQLRARPEVDPERVYLVGASFGAPFVLAAASANPEVRGVALVHGFGRVAETFENVILRSWNHRYPGAIWTRPLARLLSRLGWASVGVAEPEQYARGLVAGQRVLVISATEDSFIPPASSESLLSALQGSPASVERLTWPGDHLMPGSEELIGRLTRKIEDWMLQNALSSCSSIPARAAAQGPIQGIRPFSLTGTGPPSRTGRATPRAWPFAWRACSGPGFSAPPSPGPRGRTWIARWASG